jgi:hypothetical protein
MHSYADGKIEDTGALTRKRMETVDEEFLAAALAWMDKRPRRTSPGSCGSTARACTSSPT